MKKMFLLLLFFASVYAANAQWGSRHGYSYHRYYNRYEPRVVLAPRFGWGYAPRHSMLSVVIAPPPIVIGGNGGSCRQQQPHIEKIWVEAHWEDTPQGRVWVEGHYIQREVY